MDNEFAHDYIHIKSIGILSMCKSTIQNTKEKLSFLYKYKNIMGYQLLLIESLADADNQLINFDFHKVTQGKFPFVYSCIQPTENNTINFDNLMQELDYTRIDV